MDTAQACIPICIDKIDKQKDTRGVRFYFFRGLSAHHKKRCRAGSGTKKRPGKPCGHEHGHLAPAVS